MKFCLQSLIVVWYVKNTVFHASELELGGEKSTSVGN